MTMNMDYNELQENVKRLISIEDEIQQLKGDKKRLMYDMIDGADASIKDGFIMEHMNAFASHLIKRTVK